MYQEKKKKKTGNILCVVMILYVHSLITINMTPGIVRNYQVGMKLETVPFLSVTRARFGRMFFFFLKVC